jgi:hypothetical protein
MSRGGKVRQKFVCAIVGALLLAGGLSDCTSARSSLGTSDSSCYLDLPAAGQAVGHHGRFAGIHLFSLSQLRKKAPRLVDDLEAAHATAAHMCVAAYEGKFSAASLDKPLGRASGIFAVAVVDASNQKLLGTVLIKRVPLHFGHPHVG